MSAGKLKNLILVILLVANGFLMALVIPARREAALRQRQAREQLTRLFAQSDVALSLEEIPGTLELYPMEAFCAPEDLVPAAAAVLGGGVTKSTASGVEVTSQSGVCRIEPGGRLSATLNRSASDAAAEASSLLRQFGGRWTELTESGVGVYTARQTLAGAPILSHDVTFTFDGGDLLAVEGRILPEANRSGLTVCCGAEDALTSFLSSRLDLGWMGSRVESVTQGYVLTDGAAQGTVLLQPAWQIVTDAGVYRVDGITRAVTAE